MENTYNVLELQKLNHLQLLEIAAAMEIPDDKCKYKQETIYAILDAQEEQLLVSRRLADD